MTVKLEDFDIRYKKIRERWSDIEKCSIKGCINPRDVTEGLGEDTCCAYHRLLFDAWLYDLDSEKAMYYFTNQKARRSAFTRWRNRLGKEKCDKIVLEMAQVGINWVC